MNWYHVELHYHQVETTPAKGNFSNLKNVLNINKDIITLCGGATQRSLLSFTSTNTNTINIIKSIK